MLNRAKGATVVVGSIGWFLVGYIVAQLAAPHVWLAGLIVALSACACLLLMWFRFTPAGRDMLTSNRLIDLPGTVAVSMFLVALGTVGFAALSTALYKLGVGSVKGRPMDGHALASASYEYYLWHLADSIPLLKVPKTLNWELRHPYTDHVHGALALIYTIMVVVPLVYAATQVISAWTDNKPNDAELEEPAPSATPGAADS